MAIKTLRVFQEFTSAGYVPMPVAGNIDYGVTIAGTFPSTTPTTFQTDDPDIDVTLTATTDYYVWIRSHGTDWNPMYTRNVRVYPDSPLINNVVMGIIIANLSNTVPYTGATANVNLGEFGLTAGYLGLDITPTGTPTTSGNIYWDAADGTLNVNLLNGVVTHLGGDLPILVKSDSNSGLVKGSVVYQKSSDGANTTVLLAQANAESTSSKTFGVIANTTLGGSKAYCITFGYVRGLDTSLLTEGATVYLSPTTAGGYTTTKPQAPNHIVTVGRCIRSHATQGVIFVSIQNGFELDELHDVQITSAANKNTLVYESATSLWKNRNIFGTQGYIPYYDDTLLMRDSIIYTNGTNIGIGTTTLTEKLVVNGNILAAQFKKVGGLSTEFLKADGSSDGTAYQPLSADLTAIDNLALTTGLLRKNGTDTWELDQTEYLSVPTAISTYQRIDNLQSNLTASATKYPSVNAVNSGLALKLNLSGGTLSGGLTLNYSYPTIALSDVSSGTTWNITNDGSTFKLNYGATNKFYIFSSGNAEFINYLTANKLIKAGGVSTEFLKADGSVDTTTYQPYDADLTAIGALALTTGLLRKNGANTWELDQTEYVALATLIANYQTLANLSSNLTASSTKYPSVNAVNSGLNLKLNLSGGTMSGDLAISKSIPLIQFSDTSSGTIWNLQNNGGGFEINSGITNKFTMYSSGNATFVNDLTANKFIKSGGTSSQFLMADGSVSSGNAGTVTSVAMSVPTGLSISGSPITSSGTLALSYALGYAIPTTSSQGNWDTAYNRSLISIGVSGTTTKTLTLTKQDGTTLTTSWTDINTDAVTSVFGRTGAIVATSGDYTTAQVTESGNLYYLDSRARASVSGGTGISYNSTTGVITNTITQYTDALARASISGGTGISYNSTTGVITNTITQYTDALARASLSFTAGSGAYNSTTGVITIPTNTSQLTNGAGFITGITIGMVTTALGYTPVTNARTLTINGITYDLSVDRSWTISGTIGGLTSGYIPKATSASTLGNSLIYDSGQNIGIGTTSPTSYGANWRILELSGNSGSYLVLKGTTTPITADFAADGDAVYFGSKTAHPIIFRTSDAEKMRLTSSGNLGLGVTPSAFNAGKAFEIGTSNGNAVWGLGANALSLLSNVYYNAGYFYANNGYATRYDNGGGSGTHAWYIAPNNTSGAGTAISFTQAMTLDASGNLAVGTTNTGYGKLGVYSSSNTLIGIANSTSYAQLQQNAADLYINTNLSGASGGNLIFRFGASSTEYMRITSGGNVGIGTTSPSQKLHVDGGYTSLYGLRISGADTGNTIYQPSGDFSISSDGGNIRLMTNGSTNVVYFFTQGSERMRITSGGQVLMGTTTAQSGTRLQVANGFLDVWSSTNTLLRLNHDGTRGIIETFTGGAYGATSIAPNGGNVLIGTTTDAGYKLDVNGTGRFTSDVAISGSSGSLYSSGNFGFTATGAGGQYGIYTLGTGTPTMYFDHRATSNTGAWAWRSGTGGGTTAMTLSNAGAATFSSSVTATSFFESSDKTIKTLLVDNYQVKGIESITGKLYTKHGKEELGYFAQDVESILPSAVTKGTNGLLNLSYREVLVAKVQSLEQRVLELETQLNLR